MRVDKISIVLSTGAARFEAVAFKGDFANNVVKIAGWGYTGIELAIRDPELVNGKELKDRLAEHGLVVPAIGTGQAWGEEGLSLSSSDAGVRQNAINRIKKHIALAQQLDALVIIGLIRGKTPQNQDFTQSLHYLSESLRECQYLAGEAGVNLALEPINRYETDLINSAGEALELLGLIGGENLGLLLDTFHMNIEEVSIEETIRQCRSHIFHFHVADSNRKYPGAGHLDFKSFLATLASTGYKGWVSGEFLPYPDPETAARMNIEYLRGVMDRLKT